MNLLVRSAIGVVGFFWLATCVAAEPTTKYVHYLITGESVDRLYDAMIQRGPHVGRGKAFASVRMDPKVSATTALSGESCRINTFKFDMTFTIQLPKLIGSNALDPTAKASFEQFYDFAKNHEETHRTIWIDCGKEAEVLVAGINAKTCPAAEAESLRIIEQVAKRCDGRHASFDSAEQIRLGSHPFMQQVRLDRIKALDVIKTLPVSNNNTSAATNTMQ
jgi:predicted secreted Zn-dependent protease